MAQSNRLDRFADLRIIQQVVDLGRGKYSHEEVFTFEVGWVYQLRLEQYESAMHQQRFNYYHKEFNKTPNAQ